VIFDVGRIVPHELESHSHRAKQSLVAVTGDGPCIWEAGGPPDYDDSAYHAWYQSAQAHSTLIHPAVDLAESESRVRAFGQVDGISALVSECSLGTGTWTRTVILLDVDQPSLIVVDSLTGSIEPSEWLLVWQGITSDWQPGENRPGTRERLTLPTIGAVRVSANWPDLRTSLPDCASPSGASPGILDPHVFRPTSNDVVTFFPAEPDSIDGLFESGSEGWRSRVGRASGRVFGWALDGELVVAGRVVVRCSSADLILWSQEDDRFRAVLIVEGSCEAEITLPAARVTLDGVTHDAPLDGLIRLEGSGTFVIEGT